MLDHSANLQPRQLGSSGLGRLPPGAPNLTQGPRKSGLPGDSFQKSHKTETKTSLLSAKFQRCVDSLLPGRSRPPRRGVASVHPLAAIHGSAVTGDLVLVVLKVKLIVIAQLSAKTHSERPLPSSAARASPRFPPDGSAVTGDFPGPASPPREKPCGQSGCTLAGRPASPGPRAEDGQAAAGTPQEAALPPLGAPRGPGGSPSSRHSHHLQLFPEDSGRLPCTIKQRLGWRQGGPRQLEQGGGHGQEWGASAVPRPRRPPGAPGPGPQMGPFTSS